MLILWGEIGYDKDETFRVETFKLLIFISCYTHYNVYSNNCEILYIVYCNRN